MRATVTKLWMAIGAVAVISGCTCGDPKTMCETDVFVTFDSPKDQDIDLAATQTVAISVKDGSGTAIELDTAQLVTKAGNGSFSVPKDGVLTTGKATFASIPLEPGDNTLKVSVKQKATTCTATKMISVKVKANPMADKPKVLSVAFPQDTAMPTGTLSGLEFPNASMLTIDVETQFAMGGSIDIINKSSGLKIGGSTAPISALKTTITIQDPPFADGTYNFFAKVTKDAQSNDEATNPEAIANLKLDRTPPTCGVTAPTKMVLGPNDDADALKAGFQIRAIGTANADATTLELKFSGGAAPQTSGPKALVNMLVSNDFDVPSTGSVTYTIAAEAKDTAGNICTASRMVTVDFQCPVLTIASPDGGVETSYNVPLVANVVDGNGGSVDWKVTDSIGTRDLGIFPIASNVSSTIASLVTGPQTISATATDAVGNKCPAVTRAFSVNATTGCSIVFTRPSTRPGFITIASVNNGNYSFQAVSNCANGTFARLRQGTTMFTSPVAAGTVNWVVPVTSGMFQYKAEVGTGAMLVTDTLDVTIDLMAPAITQPVDMSILNINDDTAPGTPGVQSAFAFNATIPMGGRADVCTNQTPIPTSPAPTPCPDGSGPAWYVLKGTVTTPETTFNYPDGSYCLKLVVVSGATSNASQPVCITVDGIAPTISGITLLRDAIMDKKLNVAELAGMPPEFQFTLGSGHAQSSIKSVKVVEGLTEFNTAASVTYSGAGLNVVNVKLVQNVTASTQTYSWTILVEDLAGNVTPSPVQVVKIDKVVPTCSITAPNLPVYGKPDDAVPTSAAFDLKVDAAGSADVENITFGTTGAQVLTAPVVANSGNGTNTFVLSQTAGVLAYTVTATCTDDAKNATVATPVALSIDLQPPTCTMTTPVASPPDYTQFTLATSITVGGPGTAARPVLVFSQVGAAAAVQVGTLTVSAGGIAAGNITYLNGAQTITSRVSDDVGNDCVTAGVPINIVSAACALSIVSPTVGADGTAYFTSTAVTVTGNTSNCGAGKTVTLFQEPSTTAIGTGVTDASGNVIINATLAEGGPYTLRLSINNGSGLITNTTISPVVVDTTPPTVGTVELNATVFPAIATTATFVSATNVNRLPPTPNPAYIQDNTPGGSADFNIKVNNIVGAVGGKVRVVYGGVELSTTNVTATPQTISILGATLTHNTTGQLLIEVVDAAGLAAAALNVPAVVDVLEPAAPIVTRALLDARAATVELKWDATFDDGTTVASGANAGYEIRWSTSTVTNNNQLTLESDYLDSAKARPETNQAWIAGSTTRNVSGLPPNNSYFIVVRARDEVGNYSAYAGAPAAVANSGTQNTFANPSGVADSFALTMAAGRLRGTLSIDGGFADDLVVSGAGSAKVYVYLGGAGFTTQTGCVAPACQVVDLPGTRTPATETFGNSVAVGKVADGVNDQLLVGSANFTSTLGRVFMFFGGNNPDGGAVIENVEFRGVAGQFGRHVSVVPDINGDGFNEVGVTARSFTSNRGRFYIFKGRSKADWLTAAGGGPIAESTANWIIEGPTPVVGGNNNFAPQLSINSVGKLSGGAGNDLTLAAANENVNSVYLFSSTTLGAAGTFTTGTTAPAQQFQTITQPTTAGAVFTGFGGAVVGGVDVTDGLANDLIISNPRSSSLFVFRDGTVSSFGSPVLQISGVASMGTTLVATDLTNDGVRDLTTGEAALAGGPSRVWTFYNRSKSYDSALGGFFQSVLTGTSTTAGSFGASLTRGDFDGDGNVDIAVGDAAVTPGRVVIWR